MRHTVAWKSAVSFGSGIIDRADKSRREND